MIGLPGTTTACALKMFRNSVPLEKDPEQVNFIKIRIQGIWDCPDQDQEVGAKHVNETEMFQMTREPIDEEVGDLGDLEDVSESKHTQETTDHTDEEKWDNPDQRVSLEEPDVPDSYSHASSLSFLKHHYSCSFIHILFVCFTEVLLSSQSDKVQTFDLSFLVSALDN